MWDGVITSNTQASLNLYPSFCSTTIIQPLPAKNKYELSKPLVQLLQAQILLRRQ